MQKVKTVINLIFSRKINILFKMIVDKIRNYLYLVGATIQDKRYGNISTNGVKTTKYKYLGAFSTQSTDYRCLDVIFKSFPLKENSVFMDVGCGEGRVLTYLHKKKFKGRMLGVEIDFDIANIAKKRTEQCDNIQILCENILDIKDVIGECNCFYLFNPFDEELLLKFIYLIEENCKDKTILYYCNDRFFHLLDKREKWNIVIRNNIFRPCKRPLRYTVYTFLPD